MKTTDKSPVAQQVEGNWKQFIGKVKETWGNLTDDDLDRFNGKMDQLEGHLQERTGESRAAIKSRISEISSRLNKSV